MLALLADVNAEGHLDTLLAVCRGAGWAAAWNALGARTLRFEDVHLDRTTPDNVLWRFCQDNGIVLVTSNRNADDPTALQVTIAAEGTAASLPVLTLADADRLHIDPPYCEHAAVRLIEILLDLDTYRGTGRLWLP